MGVTDLADRAVGELREQVRAFLSSLGLVLSEIRISANCSLADIVKKGAHIS